jgi:hypothetical protein
MKQIKQVKITPQINAILAFGLRTILAIIYLIKTFIVIFFNFL